MSNVNITNYSEAQYNYKKLADDIVSILTEFTSKKIDLTSIKGPITGVKFNSKHKLETVEGDSVLFNCHYKLQNDNKINFVTINLYYKNGKLHRDGGLFAVMIFEGYIQKYVERRINGKKTHSQII